MPWAQEAWELLQESLAMTHDNVADGAQGFETTMRYIRGVQLQRDVRPLQIGHK